MNFEKLIRIGLVLVTVCLIALIFSKPYVDSRFHTKYMNNLESLDSLSGSLVRNFLLIQNAQVNHYDFLEVDLQKMSRAAEKLVYVPDHIDSSFHELARRASEDYLSQLQEIRRYAELGKRGIGLLKNSSRAIDILLEELNESNTLVFESGAKEDVAVLRNIVALNHELRIKNDFSKVQSLLDELKASSKVDDKVLAQLRLHAKVIAEYEKPVSDSATALYKASEALSHPETLRKQYLIKHEAVLGKTTRLLWASYLLALLLVLFSVILTIFANKARKETQLAMRETEFARESIEKKIGDTRYAVTKCNHLLSELGRGDFSNRIDELFTDELEDLRVGVNQAADRVEFTMSELQRVLANMQLGDFTTTIDDKVTGDFRNQVDITNTRLQSILTSIIDVMDDMKAGDFNRRIDMTLEGSFDELKSSVNSSMENLSESLGEIVFVVNQQKSGNFNYRVEGDWPGELKALSNSLNATGETIQYTVGNIQQLSNYVVDVSKSVLNNSLLLKSQSDQQATAIKTALHASETVSELINTIRKSTTTASELALNSQHKAIDCRSLSENSIHSMQTVTGKISEISKITETTALIASKTKMLALNAAVEASRAGESGKGFTVVAGEVKELARMCAEASASIAEIVLETDNEAKLGSSAVLSSYNELEKIEESAKSVDTINREVSHTSQQQIEELEVMTNRINEVFQLTLTNQSTAKDTLATSRSLDDLAKKMTSLISFFSTQEIENQPMKNAA